MRWTARAIGLAIALLLVAPAAWAETPLGAFELGSTPTEPVAAAADDDDDDDAAVWFSAPLALPILYVAGSEQVRSFGSARETVPAWIDRSAAWWSFRDATDEDLVDEAEPIPSWVPTSFGWYVDGQLDEAGVSHARSAPEVGYGELSGLWIPRGGSGRSFLLIPDDASRRALLARIANGARVEELDLLGTPKILVKLSRDGDVLLKVRARVAPSEGKGRIRYRARLSAAKVELP